jgi:hypothetical protein
MMSSEETGEEKFNHVKDKLRKALDKCDVNSDGELDRVEMKAGCLVMVKSIAAMCPGMPGGEDSELEEALDGFFAESCPDGGKISFDAMLAVALPKLCGSAPGKDPVELFDNIDQCMFTTINMQIDMYLGGLLNLRSPRVFPEFPGNYSSREMTVVVGTDLIVPNSGIYQTRERCAQRQPHQLPLRRNNSRGRRC